MLLEVQGAVLSDAQLSDTQRAKICQVSVCGVKRNTAQPSLSLWFCVCISRLSHYRHSARGADNAYPLLEKIAFISTRFSCSLI